LAPVSDKTATSTATLPFAKEKNKMMKKWPIFVVIVSSIALIFS
jgi:hypothetical protein